MHFFNNYIFSTLELPPAFSFFPLASHLISHSLNKYHGASQITCAMRECSSLSPEYNLFLAVWQWWICLRDKFTGNIFHNCLAWGKFMFWIKSHIFGGFSYFLESTTVSFLEEGLGGVSYCFSSWSSWSSEGTILCGGASYFLYFSIIVLVGSFLCLLVNNQFQNWNNGIFLVLMSFMCIIVCTCI